MTPTVESTPNRKPAFAQLIVLVIALAAGVGIFWYLSQPTDPSADVPVLTAEAKAYTTNLELGEVSMKATENALGQMLVEITGRITNNGDRPLNSVRLMCVFYDPYNQVLTREIVSIVRARDGVLNPGETRKFRLPFDALPEGWNQAMPQLVIAEILFG